MGTTNTVLILDDNSDLLELLEMIVTQFTGFEVVCISSVNQMQSLGTKALETGVAILDINLGNGNPSGLEAHQWLKDNNYKGRIYFLTGHAGSNPLVQEAQKFDDSKVLSKPIIAADLVKVIQGNDEDI